MDTDHTSDLPDDMQRWLADLDTDDQREIARTWHVLGDVAEHPGDRVAEAATDEQLARLLDDLRASRDAASRDAASRDAASRNSPGGEPSVDRTVRSERPAVASPRAGTWTRRRMVGAVGAVVLVLLASAVWMLVPTTTTAPRGERVAVTLPDGSLVTLNSGASLSHGPGMIGEARHVQLAGEAFFDVEPASRPFIVETFNASVEVVGTRFNVRSFETTVHPSTDVAVEEGTVRLRGPDDNPGAVVLRAGMGSRMLAGEQRPSAPEAVDLRPAMAWLSEEIAFVNQPLADILMEIERRYDVSIRLESAEYRTRRITLFRGSDASAKEIVGDVCGYFALECDFGKPTWVLRRPLPAEK